MRKIIILILAVILAVSLRLDMMLTSVRVYAMGIEINEVDNREKTLERFILGRRDWS